MLPSTYTFRWGEGQISGFCSAALGSLGLAAVLCFRYPQWLTFPELRGHYDPGLMRLALGVGLILALAFGLTNFCIGRLRQLGAIGMATSTIALILGGATARADGSNAFTILPIGLDWFILDLITSAVIFIPIERIFALHRSQPILREQWRLDLQYFALVHLCVSLILIVSTGIVAHGLAWAINAHLQSMVGGMAWFVQFPLILLVADLAQYGAHRAMHANPRLWRIHAIHHSSIAMDWLASSRLHLLEVLITRTLVLAPIVILGFSPLAIQLYIIYIGLHAIFVHANVRLTFGPLRHVLVTPSYHHWHHSDDPRAANTNFAVHLPVIDRIFGSFFHPREWPASYGIGPEQLPSGIFAQLAYPFRGSAASVSRAEANRSDG